MIELDCDRLNWDIGAKGIVKPRTTHPDRRSGRWTPQGDLKERWCLSIKGAGPTHVLEVTRELPAWIRFSMGHLELLLTCDGSTKIDGKKSLNSF